MSTRLVHLVIDSADPPRMAEFWADALGWEADVEHPDETEVMPAGFSYPGTAALPLVFVRAPGPKTMKNRVHLDLTSSSLDDQAAKVERLLKRGATQVDIGQRDVAWVVLADPEGNEFCVLEPREMYRDTGPVAAIVVDCPDPGVMSAFWTQAAGWPGVRSHDYLIALRSAAGEGPFLELLRSADPKRVKNRMHLDVAPPPDGENQVEAARLVQAGARPADVGQGDQPWIVLADPDGQEFCVLTAR
jgi:predicted enzyme related to lactoylglutathione lyase